MPRGNLSLGVEPAANVTKVIFDLPAILDFFSRTSVDEPFTDLRESDGLGSAV